MAYSNEYLALSLLDRKVVVSTDLIEANTLSGYTEIEDSISFRS